MNKGRISAQRDPSTDERGLTPMPTPRRVALVARDWIDEKTRGPDRFSDTNMGFAPHFSDIVRAASDAGADLIVFSLWSHDAKKLGELTRSALFPRGTKHGAVFVEVVRAENTCAEAHLRNARAPLVMIQRVGKSSDSVEKKKRLMSELLSRRFGSTLALLCGETNMINTQRTSKKTVDRFGIRSQLKSDNVELILNPVHDYMKRPEMREKRRILSKGGRVVVSVWNRGNKKGGEARLPWTAFHKGKDITNQIREYPPVNGQPGIRMGLLDLPS
jgi:hypothetical protein